MQKHYVQFSKRMVLLVNLAVTALSALAMVLCCRMEDGEAVREILKAYTGFATVCFAAYSGNSILEKWLIRRFAGQGETTEQGEGG